MVIIRFKLGGDNRVTLLISGFFAILMIIHFLEYKVTNNALLFFGKMSYTIYISHLASMCLFFVVLDRMGFPFHLKISQIYIWPIGVLFCLVMAIPLYYIGEYPTKRILKSMRKTTSPSGRG
jgi:peptidoglycan/LPS O-acetylase OafA/YrhL